MTPTAPAIAEEKALALFRVACAEEVELRGPARLIGHKKGSINEIFHIATAEKQFALRVRYNETRFQYERGIFKEVLAALLLFAYEKGNETGLDLELASSWDRINGRRSGKFIPFPQGAGIFHFDFTGTRYPGPWAVLEWTGDALGASIDAAYAFQLGQLIAQIHRMKFKSAYGNLHRLHSGGVDILSEWKDEISRRNRNTGYVIAPAEALLEKLECLHAASQAAGTDFVLCHNDLHCLNVTHTQGSLRLVDWDNAQIAPKELDFVKLAHWSRLGPNGYFQPDPAVFASFCAGYGAAPGAILSSPVFKLAELLWLFRVLEFASVLEQPANPPFWPPHRYAALLRERLELEAPPGLY